MTGYEIEVRRVLEEHAKNDVKGAQEALDNLSEESWGPAMRNGVNSQTYVASLLPSDEKTYEAAVRAKLEESKDDPRAQRALEKLTTEAVKEAMAAGVSADECAASLVSSEG